MTVELTGSVACSACPNPDPLWTAIGLLVERLEPAWIPVGFEVTTELHTYVPLRIDQFVEKLQVAMTVAPGSKYLEVGSGVGSKLVLAQGIGLETFGIEIRETLAAVSRYLAPDVPIEVSDAAYYYGYGNFDIVYAYRPFINEGPQRLYEEHLTKTMRRDSVLVSPFRVASMRDLGWRPVDYHQSVWVR